ncbi:MAG: DUF4159 domain-containing protein [Verrucomicrobia bacterium]|nr:DUF4159 domain-containing protein [Verrucomicrobiota bacterium]MCH8526334.1 DUF4159 domain-containing protein [Kiritimatiellia bacterium]
MKTSTHSSHPTALRLLLCLLLMPFARAQEEKEGVIQAANLIFAGTHTSRCFSDEFLSVAQRETGIPVARRFTSVKLDSPELFQYPFVMMTGEKDFMFSPAERENLRRYLDRGGFLLASSGCSSQEWTEAFRREINRLFDDSRLTHIDREHPLWNTVYDIEQVELTNPGPEVKISGLERNGKLVVVFSPEGLNDSAKVEGCCCCGGNEIRNAAEIVVNILVYALLY